MPQDIHNLVTPGGDLVGVAPEQLEAALAQGYTQPTQEDITSYKYGDAGNQVKAGLEGAVKGLTLGLSTGIERSLGVKKKDIEGREQANPITSMVGQVAGFIPTSALVPELGLVKGSSLLAQSGRMAAKQALETAIFQGEDEVSKAYLGDPAQSAQSIISNMGMAAAMGGGLGGLTPSVWKLAKEAKLSKFLEVLKDKVDTTAEAQMAHGLGAEAGVELSPTMAGAMASTEASRSAQVLKEAESFAGKAYRKEEQGLYDQLSEQAEQVLGKRAATTELHLSEAEQGEAIKKALTTELKAQLDPLSSSFEQLSEKFKLKALPESFKDDLAERLHNMSIEGGHTLSKDSPGLKEINRIVKDLPNLVTVEDLRKYQTIARENLYAADVPGLSRGVGKILREAEDRVMGSVLGKEGPELVAQHTASREGYKGLMDRVEALNERLHVGKFHGPGSFIKAVEEMTPEALGRRLASGKDSQLLSLVSEHFPETAQAVKGVLSDALLSKSASKLQDKVHIGDLGRALAKMSPEAKEFAFGAEGLKKLEKIVELGGKIPKNGNPSGTASMADRLSRHTLGGLGAIIGGGHGFILGELASLLKRELPDQGRLALLKALGSDLPPSANALKATAEAIHHAHEAERVLDRAAARVMSGASDVLPHSLIPSLKDQAFIDKMVQQSVVNPNTFMQNNEDLNHYSPDQQMEAIATMQRAAAYLASIRPHNDKHAPLDPRMPLSSSQKGDYKRQVMNVAQPLMILKHLKDGTIIPADINTAKAVYPNFTDKMIQKLLKQTLDPKVKSKTPYKVKQGLSLMLGRPLDSSISPQWASMNPTLQAPPQQRNGGAPRGLKKALDKLPQQDQTASQANEKDKKA